MTLDQLNQLKLLSETLESGDVDVKTIRQLSKMIAKLQNEQKNEANYNHPSIEN